MRSVIESGKADPEAMIKGQRFVFLGNLTLTLFFLILTVCFYDRGDPVVYLGAFFTLFYAFFTLFFGVKILKCRAGFFSRTKIFP
jgi:hypothetical protein